MTHIKTISYIREHQVLEKARHVVGLIWLLRLMVVIAPLAITLLGIAPFNMARAQLVDLAVTESADLATDGAYSTDSTVGSRQHLQLASLDLFEAEQRPYRQPFTPQGQEKHNTGWALYIDNDVFAPGHHDRDYTGGFALTLSGKRVKDYSLSLDGLLSRTDRWLGLDGLADKSLHSMEFGFAAFTPDHVDVEQRQANERPYASLLFLANTRQRVATEQNKAYQSTLTLGALGLPVAAQFQRQVHKALGQDEPRGWSNQISDGGELTFRYALSRQQVIKSRYQAGWGSFELKTSTGASVGYLTDANIGLSSRWGKINSPWWSFNPELTDYISPPVPVAKKANDAGASDELYLWAGASLKLSIYNALLQGQFRDSSVSFAWDELNHLVADAWLGVTKRFRDGLGVSFVLRSRSAEIEQGPASRSPVWGGFIVSRAY